MTTDRLTLRCVNLGDVDGLIAFYRDNYTRLEQWSSSLDEKRLTPEYWRERIPDFEEEMRADKSYTFYVFEREQGELIGVCSMFDVARGTMQLCSIGYHIAERFEGKGLMSEAVSALVSFAFRGADMHRLEAYFQPHNERSGRLLERLGFVVEGRIRECVRINGVWRDHMVCSLLNPEWRGLFTEPGTVPGAG